MTGGDDILGSALAAWAFAFVLLIARIGGAMALLPGLGEPEFPAMLRAGTALGITVLLLPILAPAMPPVPESALRTGAMIAAEVITGLWLGWLARLLVLALPIAGQFIAYMLGLANVLQPDAMLGGQATAVARLFAVAAPLVILTTGLYAVPMAALANSYRLVPPGALLPAGGTAEGAVHAASASFALAVRLASPFLLVSIIWHVVTGLLARMVPRLQVYFVVMPGQILGGFLLLAILSSALLTAWQASVRAGFVGLAMP